MRNLGSIYKQKEDNDKAKEWYQKALENGNGEAASGFAEIDKDNARKYFENAAKLDHPYDVFTQGWYAEITDNNPTKAMEYYQQAADLGSVLGLNYIGEIYREGKGVPKDYKKTESYYLKAAKKENGGFAMCQIGHYIIMEEMESYKITKRPWSGI